MVRVRKKESLNETVSKMVLEAPMIAKKAQPGQFVIVRAKEESERIPLTIADYDRKEGTVTIIYQIVGAGTMELDTVREGEYVQDLVGPLGKASETEGLHKVAVVGGGVGYLTHELLRSSDAWNTQADISISSEGQLQKYQPHGAPERPRYLCA